MEQRQKHVDAIAALVPVTLRNDLMMTSAQVRQLHQAGIEIGGHTVNHPIIARLPAAAARQEIAGGKAGLEAMIGAPVRLFAYPDGKPGQDYQAEHVAMVSSSASRRRCRPCAARRARAASCSSCRALPHGIAAGCALRSE